MTAGGDLSLHVRRAILASAETMARGGSAAWYNPAWLFLRGFYRIYLRVSQGASRLQEVLADRWAALCYGARAFTDGLRHVVRRSIAFDALANHEIGQALRAGRSLQNLYGLTPRTGELPTCESASVDDAAAANAAPDADPEAAPLEPPTAPELEEAYLAALEERGSPYDSHPTPLQRIVWVSRLQGAPELEDDGAPAWDLLADREALQAAMTAQVDGRVQLAVALEAAPAAS